MFGNDDPFDRLAREFFGANRDISDSKLGSRSNVSRDQNSIVSNMGADYDRVEGGADYFVIVNFVDNVKKTDIHLDIEEDFSDEGSDGWFGGGDKVLSIQNKNKKDSFLRIRIPKKVAKRKMSHTFNNGILEVRFGK